jgi:hypothetical protein
MNEIVVSTWTECEEAIASIRRQMASAVSPLLFRGHGNSDWSLETTLERAGKPRMRLEDYCRLIMGAVKPAVESLTGKTWDGVEYGFEFESSLRHYDAINHFPSASLYSYMVYLRHHGFPSPLLDWSHSAQVAAFFAFRERLSGVSHRRLYVFCEKPETVKAHSGDEPRVHAIGPYVRSHRRHYRQHVPPQLEMERAFRR